jgi:hypothetical protein
MALTVFDTPLDTDILMIFFIDLTKTDRCGDVLNVKKICYIGFGLTKVHHS